MFLTCTLNTCDTCLIVQHLNSDIRSRFISSDCVQCSLSSLTVIKKNFSFNYSAIHRQIINNFKEHLLIHVFYQCFARCFCFYLLR